MKSPAAAAVKQCDRIIDKCDEIPFEGADFAESIRGKVESIRKWIEQHGRVTPKQQDALDNMESGADRWLEDEDDDE